MNANETGHGTDDAEQHNNQTDTLKPTHSIPPTAMTDEKLLPLAEKDNITHVWVPRTRRLCVIEGGIRHEGDILDFWVEGDETYTHFSLSQTEDMRVRWVQHPALAKDEKDGLIAKESMLKHYRRLTDDEWERDDGSRKNSAGHYHSEQSGPWGEE